MSQDLSVEILPTFVEGNFSNVSACMSELDESERRRRFSEYVQTWMLETGLRNPGEVEERSRKRGKKISDALVSKFINQEKGDCNASSLEALADALTRPPDEVFLAWLGRVPAINTKEYKESDAAHVWQLIKNLPRPERNIYIRYLRMLYNDVLKVIDSLKSE